MGGVNGDAVLCRLVLALRLVAFALRARLSGYFVPILLNHKINPPINGVNGVAVLCRLVLALRLVAFALRARLSGYFVPILLNHKINPPINGWVYLMVPAVGFEPTRYRYRGILSPVRLPVSPRRHVIRGKRLPKYDNIFCDF